MSIFDKPFRFLASYGLSCVLFLLLLLLTYLGTVEQVDHGLYATQKKYFESIFLVHWALGNLPIPLPGAYLLMVVLFVNLLCGGILRARKGWRQLGILIAHAGICVMLAGSFFTFKYALNGQLTLYERQESNRFQSYHEWEITLAEAGGGSEYVIGQEDFASLEGSTSRVFRFPDLPVELAVSGYAPNAEPRQAGQGVASPAKAVDGFFLRTLDRDPESERNVPGAYATLSETATGAQQEGILWGFARAPLVLEAAGKKWALNLRHRSWELPFSIVLNKFERELHPGTGMAKSYASEVTRIEDGVGQQVRIAMNAPLRHRGYTLYQSSWGPSDAKPGTPLYSVFSVVKNPTDQFPLYSCIIITIGMLVHFSLRLFRYMRTETRRSA